MISPFNEMDTSDPLNLPDSSMEFGEESSNTQPAPTREEKKLQRHYYVYDPKNTYSNIGPIIGKIFFHWFCVKYRVFIRNVSKA